MGTIMPFQFDGQQVRTVSDQGERVWFVAKDVCDVLGIRKYRDALTRLDDDETRTLPVIVDTLGGVQTMTAVDESGLYALIMRSRKPEAQAFRKWVTRDVLPSIRRTGRYELPSDDPPGASALAARLIRRTAMIGSDLDMSIRNAHIVCFRHRRPA